MSSYAKKDFWIQGCKNGAERSHTYSFISQRDLKRTLAPGTAVLTLTLTFHLIWNQWHTSSLFWAEPKPGQQLNGQGTHLCASPRFFRDNFWQIFDHTTLVHRQHTIKFCTQAADSSWNMALQPETFLHGLAVPVHPACPFRDAVQPGHCGALAIQ